MIPAPRPAPEGPQRCLRHHRVMANCQSCRDYLHDWLIGTGVRR